MPEWVATISSTTSFWPSAARALGSPEAAAYLFLRGKAVPDQTEELLAIMADVLLTPKLDNKERVRQMVLEERAGFESRWMRSSRRGSGRLFLTGGC